MYENELKVGKEIAAKAGEVILRYFDADQQVERKADSSAVTIADKLVNRMVIDELARAFPEDGVIGEEESTAEYGGGRRWLCDPIDGTAGYVWGTPTAMFSLALVIDGNPVLGITYDPFLKRLYEAVRGQGSYCNGQPIHVSAKDFATGTIAVSGSVKLIPRLTYLPKLVELGSRLATFSGAVYKACLVARGKFTAYVEHGLSGHDLAAVQVIVEEAGGRITGLRGETLDYSQPLKGGVVSNAVVHEQLVKLINDFPVEP